MQIIKDKKIIQDTWHFVADNEPLAKGDITVTVKRWQKDKTALLAHQGQLGLRLNSTDDIESLKDDLAQFKLIELYFAAFTDGRSFSQAWLLRNRLNYQGDIKATGHFMRDQLFYLYRVGVNIFKLDDGHDMLGAVSLLNDFSVSYQASTN